MNFRGMDSNPAWQHAVDPIPEVAEREFETKKRLASKRLQPSSHLDGFILVTWIMDDEGLMHVENTGAGERDEMGTVLMNLAQQFMAVSDEIDEVQP